MRGAFAFAGVDQTFTSEQFDREWERSTRQGGRPVPVDGEAGQAPGLPVLRPQLRPPARAMRWMVEKVVHDPDAPRRRSRALPRDREPCAASSATTSPRFRSSPAASSPAGSPTADRDARSTLRGDEDRRRSRRAGRASPRPCSRSCASAVTSRSARRPGRRRRDDWAWASEAAARDVAEGPRRAGDRLLLDRDRRLDRRQQGPGRPRRALPRRADRRGRAALERRQRARAQPPRHLRGRAGEILDAWFAGEPSAEADDRANVEHLDEIEGGW